MKRSGPPQRKTPLKSSPLERTAAWPAPATARSSLHANSAAQRHQPKRSAPGIPAKVRRGLAARSGGVCEIGQRGCTVQATDASHRVKVGIGGRKGAAAVAHHVLSNLLAACRVCHSQTLHAQPALAYRHGWMLREGQNTLTEACLYRGAVRWLSDDGAVLTSNPTPEEATA
jgi:hypothetical protein